MCLRLCGSIWGTMGVTEVIEEKENSRVREVEGRGERDRYKGERIRERETEG